MRRSRSGGQLKTLPAVPASSAHATHSSASLRPPRPIDKDVDHSGPEPRGIPSTTALAEQPRPRALTLLQEPVKSIDEIVRAHSSSCLTVPSLPRGPQRSVSWSAFEHSDLPQKSSWTNSEQQEAYLERDSISSEDSVERETRTMLQSVQIAHLERDLPRLSLEKLDSRLGRPGHSAQQTQGSRSAAPTRSSQSTTRLDSLSRKRRGLTCCAHITIPGAPGMQVSFADVGEEKGRAVMVFLGLGASRHLVGLYDDLATSLGLRLICVDRWGIGRTDSPASEPRTILGWSLIVEQVADLLAIERFSVLAHSAGAPFAAAVALLFPDRIQGPVRLLAPWAGMQQDSGYRWLRYVPEGVIKTAQAAEWKLQNWRLGKEAPKTPTRTAMFSSDDDWSGDRQLSSPSNDGTAPDFLSRRTTGQQEAGSRRAIDEGRPTFAGNGDRLASEEEEREGALALLNASRTESARGLVDDMSLVLGKKPWGFDYADVQVACEVWHGSKDERIPLSSSVKLSREMRNCSLHVIDGASHSLMTNTSVVVEVFESIRKHSG